MRLLLIFSFLLIYPELFSMNPENNSNISYADSLYTFNDTSKTHDYFIINNIKITGNKLTKDYIIHRELLFKVNDTINRSKLSLLLKNSRDNLINTSLFNFVYIDTSDIAENPDRIDININVIERWYIWPFPIFEIADRNFNSWWKSKDYSKINYGLFLTIDNFRGRKETLVLYTRFGYDEKYRLSYKNPYINKAKTIGMGFGGGFAQNHEVSYMTVDNEVKYFKEENSYPKREIFSYLEFFLRKNINNTHWIKLNYSGYHFSDSLLDHNPNYSYGNKNVNQYLSLYYQFKSDYRDYKHYPLTGHYFDVEVNKKGLGILDDGLVNLFFIKSSYRKYFHLNKKFYFASGITGKISAQKKQPYFIQQGLGYGRDFVRSYEYYVIDGVNFALLKTNFKYELLPTKIIKFKFLPTEKFNTIHFAIYLNLFTDIAYVGDSQSYKYNNLLSNELLVGYGAGIDLVTYYDIVLRLEYSINKMGEKGLFIHFMASI
ncbi:MAG: hypothetical protein K8R58_07480 [Bacteroidales bacterium]|nr:hypothetical protein [Bacteroidales bacterium]